MRQFGWLGTCELVYERLPVKEKKMYEETYVVKKL